MQGIGTGHNSVDRTRSIRLGADSFAVRNQRLHDSGCVAWTTHSSQWWHAVSLTQLVAKRIESLFEENKAHSSLKRPTSCLHFGYKDILRWFNSKQKP